METDTITTVLIALCPAVSAVITALIGFLSLIRTIKQLKNDNADIVKKSNERIERMEKKLNTVTVKLASIEQYLVEKKEKRKHE
jgi:hypothetical protein